MQGLKDKKRKSTKAAPEFVINPEKRIKLLTPFPSNSLIQWGASSRVLRSHNPQ